MIYQWTLNSLKHIRYALVVLVTYAFMLPAAQAIQDTKAVSSTTGEGLSAAHFAQVTIGLMVVIIVIFGLAWLVKRFGYLPSSKPGALKIIGGLMVGQRERAVLIQVGDKQILIGVAPGLVKTLYVLEEPVSVDSASSAKLSPFAERLKSFLRDKAAS